MNEYEFSGNIVDLHTKNIYPGIVKTANGKIVSIQPSTKPVPERYILPGFIDAHIHIESSMMVPSEFARLAVTHGTVATVSDPHEIGNVLGIEGVRYMLRNAAQVPFHFYFGAPSCVPATKFETAGAEIPANDIKELFTQDKLSYLSEMMNYPGVLSAEPLVMEKIKIAHELRLPVDGHAPGLKGDMAQRYISAGISTDHECYSLDEALDKLRYGMKILIREGSAAKNFEALHPLIASHHEHVMFCCDDKHPHELVDGHINEFVKRSVALGYNTLNVLQCACYNPVKHYSMNVGLLREGDHADFIIVDNLRDFTVLQTWIKGHLVAENGKSLIPSIPVETINHFQTRPKVKEDFSFTIPGDRIQVIQAIDGELITKKIIIPVSDRKMESDIGRDILKLVVVNRYNNAPPAIAFINGFGLNRGALASCIAHDSHNIIAVGTSDSDICDAVNAIIAHKGGISLADSGAINVLPLPVAGIMSNDDGYVIARKYAEIDKAAKTLGTSLQAPYMTLSFMALLVIPSLKLSDKGLFDGERFRLTAITDTD